MTAVLGEFLVPAGEHIAAAASFRGELPYTAQHGAVCQLDRLTTIFLRYLADLPLPDALDPAQMPERNAAARAHPAMLALDRAARVLHRAAATAPANPDTGLHPLVAHLAAAADYLTAGHDLLHTHFMLGADGITTSSSWWAPAITSAPVTAALLAELGSYAGSLTPWISRLTPRTPGTRALLPRHCEHSAPPSPG